MGRRAEGLARRVPDATLPAGRGGGFRLSRRRTPERLPGLVDSHAHLQHARFDADRDAVIQRAVDAGVEHILVPGWDLASSEAALELAAAHPGVIHAAVGVHPHDAADMDERAWAGLESLAAGGSVWAIGEIGLDFFRKLSPPAVQRDALARQLSLAAGLGLPVLVHDRDAHEETTDTLLSWDGRPGSSHRGVLHAFSGDASMARRLSAAGFLISFALPVAFRSAAGPRESAGLLEAGRFLVETDSPYLGPDRDRRNEPTTVLRVTAELARMRGVEPWALVESMRAAFDGLVTR